MELWLWNEWTLDKAQDTWHLFFWLSLVVNDRKFSAGTVFFSHINQPAVLLHEPATTANRTG